MMTTRKLANISLVALLTVAAVGACSSDDDDGDQASGGRGGSSAGGSLSMGGDGTPPSEGGGDGAVVAGGGPSQAGRGGAPDPVASGGMGGDTSALGGAGPAGGAAAEGLSDPQILRVLDTLNRGEVEEAYAVLPRLSDADVEAFAQTMIEDHGGARLTVAETAQTLEVDPAPSGVERMLAGESEAQVNMLRATPASALDATYISLQVAAHAEALALLGQLDSAADAAELRAVIQELTTAAQHHYDTALEIEGSL